MAIQTTSLLPPPVQIYYDRVLLSMAEPNLIFTKLAMKKNLSARSGNTIRFERWNDIGSKIVPLGNIGITPPSSDMTRAWVDAEINWFGTYIEINEQVDLTSQSPVLNQRAKLLGRSMRFTEDELVRNLLVTTPFVLWCVAGVNGRIVAVLKSFLMGLKLLPGRAGDNKAQASLGCAA